MFDLYLIHGRDAADQDMDDWGFDGPRLPGVVGTHQTYSNPLRIVFADTEACQIAKAQTGWEAWDSNVLEMRWQGDCVVANGKFYGDWGLVVSADAGGNNRQSDQVYRSIFERIAARLRGEWHDPHGDLESDIAGVIATVTGACA